MGLERPFHSGIPKHLKAPEVASARPLHLPVRGFSMGRPTTEVVTYARVSARDAEVLQRVWYQGEGAEGVPTLDIASDPRLAAYLRSGAAPRSIGDIEAPSLGAYLLNGLRLGSVRNSDVTYLDGSPLNCTRENIVVQTATPRASCSAADRLPRGVIQDPNPPDPRKPFLAYARGAEGKAFKVGYFSSPHRAARAAHRARLDMQTFELPDWYAPGGAGRHLGLPNELTEANRLKKPIGGKEEK